MGFKVTTFKLSDEEYTKFELVRKKYGFRTLKETLLKMIENELSKP